MADPKLSGTWNAIDRSKQYTRADNGELLRSLNEAWSKIRKMENSLIKKDVEIGVLRGKIQRTKIVNIALTSIVTGLAWEGLKFVLPLIARYLGLG